MDMTAITAVLGSIKTATEIAKYIKDSNVSFEKAETKLRLAELIGALADAKLKSSVSNTRWQRLKLNSGKWNRSSESARS